jgi:hypothetical protein
MSCSLLAIPRLPGYDYTHLHSQFLLMRLLLLTREFDRVNEGQIEQGRPKYLISDSEELDPEATMFRSKEYLDPQCRIAAATPPRLDGSEP